MSAPLELIKASVNRHGELHLDRERTEALIRWLTVCEVYEKETQRLFGELTESLQPLGLALEQYEEDKKKP